MTHPLYLTLALFWLTFPLGQFAKFIAPVLLGLIAFFTLTIVAKGKNSPYKKILISWLCLIIWMGITLVVNPLHLNSSQILLSALYLLRFLCGSTLIFSGILLESHKTNIFRLMIVAAVGLAVSGYAQYVFFPYLGPLTALGWDPHLYRLVGSFLDPGFTGIILVFAFLLIGLTKNQLRLTRTVWAILASTFYVALALTYSRASYLAFLAGLTTIAIKRRAYSWLTKVIIFFAITIILLPRPPGEGVRLERENSFKARIINWSHAITIFSQHPVTGVGFNTYGFAQEQAGYVTQAQDNHAAFGSDSSWLLILATTGLIGLIIFGYFLKTTFTNDLLVVSTAGALFIHSWFLNSLFYPWVLSWIALLVGLTQTTTVQTKPKAV